MAKVIIRLKSGFELPIICEKYEFRISDLTGQLVGYTLKGIQDNKPVYFDQNDVECVYEVLNEEKKDELQSRPVNL